ncbi:efflux RND transporter periplasmic adaptor subunit [Ornithobacterium rhinotracheale]|uniref:efflux RND transporter periplasmic adaptor subunit n=2 Tax=Ornithobacterium rhinotracheale TaxID=28251 RepID=UPI001FF56930|nr:efflux RND transporter periplasmic adaptor subunit [Ornithobacterium rhinotracheale]MCK0200121.1 RND transporter [Ornithobacterium rhinotracheale]
MDTKIQKKRGFKKYVWISLGVVLLGVAAYFLLQQQTESLNIDRNRVKIAEVQKGEFEDILLLNATTESRNSTLVNVLEGGVVQEIYVEDGAMVEMNQALAKIYNPNTELSQMNQETQMLQQINQMQNTILNLKNQSFEQEKERLQSNNDYRRAQQEYETQKRLYEAEIGRKNDFLMAKQNFEYQQKRKQVLEQSIKSEQNTRNQQIAATQTAMAQMQKSLQLLEGNKQNFIIKSPAKGRLSSFTLTRGQNLVSGENIGKVDLLDGYKLVAKVDEFYNNRLRTGIAGTLTTNGKEYAVFVSKILPEVKDRQFEVVLDFSQDTPPNLRIGMSFGIKLQLSDSVESILLSKGDFHLDTQGDWVFVVNGNTAERRNIKLGKENNRFYEIIEGLQPGEQVIITNYKDLKNYNTIHLKN